MIKKNGGLFGRNPTFNNVVVEGSLETAGGVINTGAALIADTDPTLSANSDDNVATQKAVKTYVDGLVVGLLDFKGLIDCSSNPNYPAALKGDTYLVSGTGKIGGASGVNVFTGDAIIAAADNAGGTQASVGSSWFVLERNLDNPLLAANNLSDVANAATARSNLGLGSAATTSSTDYAPAAKGVTNGDSHDHNGGDGAQIAYSSLSGLPTLGTAAAAATTDFAPAAKGVTNGDSHDHSGGDGAQIAYSSLSGTPSLATVATSGSYNDLSNKPSLGTISSQNANNVAITGGAIDGTPIGATTASSGKFSSVTNTALTSGRVPYATTGGQLTDTSNLTWDGTRLVASKMRNSQAAQMLAFVQSMIEVAGSGGCNSNGPSMTFKSVNVNGTSKAMFAVSNSGTPAGYQSLTSDEGYFVMLSINCGNQFSVSFSTSIPSYWNRVYIRDDWFINTLF